MRIVEMVRNDIKNSSLLKTKFLIYAFNGRTYKKVGWCKNVLVEISNLNSNLDFGKSNNSGLKEPCINASFLQGKKWMLDYKRRRLLILGSD